MMCVRISELKATPAGCLQTQQQGRVMAPMWHPDQAVLQVGAAQADAGQICEQSSFVVNLNVNGYGWIRNPF